MIPRRFLDVVACAGFSLALVSASSAAPKASPTEPPSRQIQIVVNGTTLEADPAPRILNDHLLVPVVRVFSSLAISVSRDGDNIVATAPTKTIKLTIGSRRATVDGKPVLLDSPAIEIDGATYVPLRFITDSLGADVGYNSRAGRIDIVSALIGRVVEPRNTGGKTTITGTLTAIDRNSQPASVTVTSRNSVRTISINSTAKIVTADVVARSEQPGALGDLHVGDALTVVLAKDGSVDSIRDLFASRTGTIAAVSSSAVVLENGRVISPDKTTEITLNGDAAKIADLKVGDTLTQRSNPDSGETRQVIVSRKVPVVAGAVPSPGAVTIASIAATPNRPAKLGETFEIILKGTAGGRATYDLGTYLTAQPMREETPGVYRASLKIAPGLNFTQAALVGHLNVGGADAPRSDATQQLSVATIAPQIPEVAPANGSSVNNNRPSVYATFTTPTDLGINPGSVSIRVNNSDVTASAVRTPTFITYTPSVALADGAVNVTVSVADLAGNTTSRSWSFTIRSK